MEIKIWKSNSNLKFEIWFKQKSKFEFYVLFFEKLKIDEKGFLRVMCLIRGVLQCREDFVKKRTEVHFSIFIENRNWDLKFVFRFDNANEKRKKKKTLFHFKTKIEYPFRPTDSIRAPKVSFNFQIKIRMKKGIFAHFNFNSKLKTEKRHFFFNFQFSIFI